MNIIFAIKAESMQSQIKSELASELTLLVTSRYSSYRNSYEAVSHYSQFFGSSTQLIRVADNAVTNHIS